MERLINIDPQLLHDTILMAISVFLLFTFLSYLLFNPVRKMLQDRKDKIRNDLNEAETEKDNAQALKVEYEGKLANVDQEVEAILSEARQRALAYEARMVEKAKADAARIIDRANEEILLEKKRELDSMKQEIVAIASLMAEKVISAKIDENVQNGLVEETIKEIGDRTWLS